MKLSDDTAFNTSTQTIDIPDPRPSPEEWLIALESAAEKDFEFRCYIRKIPTNPTAKKLYVMLRMEEAVHGLF